METFLSFSSFGSLRTYLNIILIGIVVFIAVNRFSYLVNVMIYAIAETLIPMVTSFLLGLLLGTSSAVSIGTIFLSLIVYFILGLPVIKITEKITNYFDSDKIIYFIIAFAIIDLIISLAVVLLLNLIF